jgi:hypothetical protein
VKIRVELIRPYRRSIQTNINANPLNRQGAKVAKKTLVLDYDVQTTNCLPSRSSRLRGKVCFHHLHHLSLLKA